MPAWTARTSVRAAVRAVVRSRAAEPDEVSAAVVAAVVDYQDGFPNDDIAVLTLRPSTTGRARP